MDQAYHFLVEDPTTGQLISNQAQLPAPQANMLAAVSRGLMDDPANQPWLLYGLGGIVAVMLFMAGVPMLAFALGMYLPISINMAVLAGAACGAIISRTGGSPEVRKARSEQGILIASGMMAGAAIFGILTAALRLPDLGALIQYVSVGVDFSVADGQLQEQATHWFEGSAGQLISLGMLVLLGFACFGLAKLGAKWELRSHAPSDKEESE
jgi:hypothetical protein